MPPRSVFRGAIGRRAGADAPPARPLEYRKPEAMKVVPFPYGRRRHLVERHARAMRGRPPAEAQAYLIGVLERVCDELEPIGIRCEDADAMIDDFALAIGKELHGPSFRLTLDGAK